MKGMLDTVQVLFLPYRFGAGVLLLSMCNTRLSADPVPVVCEFLVVFAATRYHWHLASQQWFIEVMTLTRKMVMLFTCRVFILLRAALEGGFAAGMFCRLLL